MKILKSFETIKVSCIHNILTQNSIQIRKAQILIKFIPRFVSKRNNTKLVRQICKLTIFLGNISLRVGCWLRDHLDDVSGRSPSRWEGVKSTPRSICGGSATRQTVPTSLASKQSAINKLLEARVSRTSELNTSQPWWVLHRCHCHQEATHLSGRISLLILVVRNDSTNYK